MCQTPSKLFFIVVIVEADVDCWSLPGLMLQGQTLVKIASAFEVGEMSPRQILKMVQKSYKKILAYVWSVISVFIEVEQI